MNDIPCQKDDQFLCEFDESRNEIINFDQIEQFKFFKPLKNDSRSEKFQLN